MQEERRVANGTEKRKPSGPFAYGENEDSSFARGESRSSGCRDRLPSGNLDLRRFEDPDENFVYLVNSVPGFSGFTHPQNLLRKRHRLGHESLGCQITASDYRSRELGSVAPYSLKERQSSPKHSASQ